MSEALKVVKWEGDAPPTGGRFKRARVLAWCLKRSRHALADSVLRGEVEPVGHPLCEEVVAFDLQTGGSRVIYRR